MRKLIALIVVILFSCSTDDTFTEPEIILDEFFFVDRQVMPVFENDSNGINLIFLGEGYTKKDLNKDTGIYYKDAIRHIEHLFNSAPFSQYKQYFNAYIVFAESEEELGNTAFNVTYTGSTNNSNPKDYNKDKVVRYANRAVNNYVKENNIVLLSINSRGGGGAVLKGGIALFGHISKRIMLHEVGHAFAGLGDEYFFRNTNENTTSFDINKTPNLDVSGNFNTIKWSHFFGIQGYESVDIIEGGGHLQRGVFRAEFKSVMGGRISNNSSDTFNAVSREAIVKRVFEIKQLPYHFEDFIIIDRTRGTTGTTTNNTIEATTNLTQEEDQIIYYCDTLID